MEVTFSKDFDILAIDKLSAGKFTFALITLIDFHLSLLSFYFHNFLK